MEDLALNGYPEPFVRKELARASKRKDRTNPMEKGNAKEITQQRSNTMCTIPYISGVSEAIGRILRPLEIRTVMNPNKIKWSI